MKKILYQMIIIIVSMSLTGCSMLSPVKVPEQTSYFFEPNISVVSAVSSHQTILVTTPQAAAGYTTKKMAYMDKPLELSYYTRNRWVAPPAKMLQPLIVQALQQTHRFNAVASSPFSGKADFRLDSDLVYIRQNLLTHPHNLEIALQVRLIENKNQRIVASQLITQIEPILKPAPYAGVLSSNVAWSKALASLANFVVDNTYPRSNKI